RLSYQAVDVRGPGDERQGGGVRRRVAKTAAQHLDPRPERGSATVFPAVPPQHRRAATTSPCRQLLGQPGLANARLAPHADEPPSALECRRERPVDPGQLVRTTDECLVLHLSACCGVFRARPPY